MLILNMRSGETFKLCYFIIFLTYIKIIVFYDVFWLFSISFGDLNVLQAILGKHSFEK